MAPAATLDILSGHVGENVVRHGGSTEIIMTWGVDDGSENNHHQIIMRIIFVKWPSFSHPSWLWDSIVLNLTPGHDELHLLPPSFSSNNPRSIVSCLMLSWRDEVHHRHDQVDNPSINCSSSSSSSSNEELLWKLIAILIIFPSSLWLTYEQEDDHREHNRKEFIRRSTEAEVTTKNKYLASWWSRRNLKRRWTREGGKVKTLSGGHDDGVGGGTWEDYNKKRWLQRGWWKGQSVTQDGLKSKKSSNSRWWGRRSNSPETTSWHLCHHSPSSSSPFIFPLFPILNYSRHDRNGTWMISPLIIIMTTASDPDQRRSFLSRLLFGLPLVVSEKSI